MCCSHELGEAAPTQTKRVGLMLSDSIFNEELLISSAKRNCTAYSINVGVVANAKEMFA